MTLETMMHIGHAVIFVSGFAIGVLVTWLLLRRGG